MRSHEITRDHARSHEIRSELLTCIHAFDFYVYAQDYQELPELSMLKANAKALDTKYVGGGLLPFLGLKAEII